MPQCNIFTFFGFFFVKKKEVLPLTMQRSERFLSFRDEFMTVKRRSVHLCLFAKVKAWTRCSQMFKSKCPEQTPVNNF